MNRAFWRDRRVLVTGHTGFKGGWLALWLQAMGAKVSGLALPPPTQPSLFDVACVGAGMDSRLADLRDAQQV
jgi:CDP-glucose 4,6-dehydratase